MPHRYPRPPITVAGLFLTPPAEPLPPAPAWWPNDKQLVLVFRKPVSMPAIPTMLEVHDR